MDMSISLLLSLPLLLLIFPSRGVAVSVPGTINRTLKQQILVNLPPHPSPASVLFLTSPSGKYAAYFLRRPTAPGAGGFGNDFCFVEVIDTSSKQSLWESDCAPVSTSNACTLVFDNAGLEVFDGSRSSWDTSANSNNFLKTIELVDEGDMRIRDQDGNMVWKASDNPQAGQNCGFPGAPGLAYANPPFAGPFPTNQPFGQQLPQQNGAGLLGASVPAALPVALPPVGDEEPGQQQQLGVGAPAVGTDVQQQPLGGSSDGNVPQNAQPLVDNTPFNSKAMPSGLGGWLQMSASLVLGLGALAAVLF